MSSTWRVLLVWLMACALPLQGLAAARLQHCAPGHPAAVVAAQVPPVATAAMVDHATHADHGARPAGNHHDGSHDHRHHEHHQADPGAAAADAAQPAQDGGTGSCSACAACCAAAALFVQAPGLPETLPDTPVPQRLPLVSATFLSDGPDRPPRLPRT
jgi:hypothetical protein